MPRGSIISLNGRLGAGKTTFVKGIALGLGIMEPVTSPTFTLISEYTGYNINLYHMDMYRIESYEELMMTGGEELMNGDGISIIEWADKIKKYLPDDTIEINIEIKENFDREITVEGL